MEGSLTYTYVIILLPLAAFLINGLLNKKLPNSVASAIAVIAIVGAAIMSYSLAAGYFFDFGNVDGAYIPIKAFDHAWLAFTESLQIKMGMLVDQQNSYRFQPLEK